VTRNCPVLGQILAGLLVSSGLVAGLTGPRAMVFDGVAWVRRGCGVTVCGAGAHLLGVAWGLLGVGWVRRGCSMGVRASAGRLLRVLGGLVACSGSCMATCLVASRRQCPLRSSQFAIRAWLLHTVTG